MIYCVCMIYIVYAWCILCICSSGCCVELNCIEDNCKMATLGVYLKLKCVFIQICALDIWIWCILCICNTFSCVEHNFIRKNWKRVKFGSAESEAVHIRFIPTIQAFAHSNLCSGRQDMIYCMYRMYFMYLQQTFLCRPQLNSRKLYASHMWLIPNTQADIHSNVFMACWDMVYCVCMMYLVYMQQLLLCRLQLNLRQLQDSYIWLLPNITPFVLSNLFIGHWDMMYLVYIQHRSSCRGKFRSKELKESQIRQRRIWGCAHSVHTYNSSFYSSKSV